MNEKMKLKIEREIFPQCIGDLTKDTGEVIKNSFDKYKFAELIVRECLAQVDKVDEMLEVDSEKAGVAWVGYAIEKHFGVKE